MSAKLVLDTKGIVLAPGELSRAPGSLVIAQNVNVEAPGVIRSRQGVQRLSEAFGGPIWKLVNTKELGSFMYANYGSNTVATGLKYGDGVNPWTAITGTFTNQPATRMQCAVGRTNHYLTTDEGVRRLESTTPPFAGMPKGLGLNTGGPTAILVRSLNYDAQAGSFTAGLTVTGGTSGATGVVRADNDGGSAGVLSLSGVTGTFQDNELIEDSGAGEATANGTLVTGVLADGSAVAYRVTWCKKDNMGVVMEGAPSDRRVIYNNTRTSGWVTLIAQNILCRIPLPKAALTASTALTTDYFWRLYRSAAEEAGTEPSDDMNLVGEAFLTSGNISAGYVEFVDATPDGYREKAPALYTNEGVGGDVGADGLQGLELANNIPPRARDVALFAECMFYGDLLYPNALNLTLLSVVPGLGLTAADTLTIGGIVYTAHGSTTADNQFVVVTSTGPTGSTNSEAIERTAQNLVTAINTSTTNTTTWAEYITDPDGLPGQIRLVSRTGNASAFSAVASLHGNAFRPSIASAVSAAADTYANGYTFSKPNQPDAVPSVNLGRIGRDDTALLRMQVLRDAVYFFTDCGIYVLTGRTVNDFAVQEFDLSFRLRGRDMVCVCDDAIYAWGWEGIARITRSGVEYISNGIEPLVWKTVLDAGSTWLASYAWATAYRSRHKVLFAVPMDGTNGNCATIYAYDTRMQAWTSWLFIRGTAATVGHSCGVVRVSDDLLMMGQWNSSGGDAKIFKERLTYTAADYVDDTVDTSNEAIAKQVQWNCVTSSPELETHWDELHLLFDVSPTFSGWTTPTALTVVFTSDLASASANLALAPTAASRMSRCLVSQAQRRSARLTVTVYHTVASQYFGLEGMALVHLPGEGTATTRT